MIKPLFHLSLLAAGAMALGACVPSQQLDTGAAGNYQAPAAAIAPPANVKSICFRDAEVVAYRVRMVQQELAVGVLSCKSADGSRKFDRQYSDFLAKFNPELATNARELEALVRGKGRNFDVVITEIANRTAQRPVEDPAFCSRHGRALDLALAPTVTSLSQVPSPYDFGPEMNVFPCPKQ
jgi:hypothetical protein